MPYGKEDLDLYNSINQPNTGVIDYGQYNNYRIPKTTTTKRTVTVEEYDENGKLVKKHVEATEETVTTDGYPYITWNSPQFEVKYSNGVKPEDLTRRIGDSIKMQLDLMDR